MSYFIYRHLDTILPLYLKAQQRYIGFRFWQRFWPPFWKNSCVYILEFQNIAICDIRVNLSYNIPHVTTISCWGLKNKWPSCNISLLIWKTFLCHNAVFLFTLHCLAYWWNVELFTPHSLSHWVLNLPTKYQFCISWKLYKCLLNWRFLRVINLLLHAPQPVPYKSLTTNIQSFSSVSWKLCQCMLNWRFLKWLTSLTTARINNNISNNPQQPPNNNNPQQQSPFTTAPININNSPRSTVEFSTPTTCPTGSFTFLFSALYYLENCANALRQTEKYRDRDRDKQSSS